MDNWRDHPDYREEDAPGYNPTLERFQNMPCSRFSHHRQQQARIDYSFHRMMIEMLFQSLPVRERARRVYRALRKTGVRLARHNLYAPAPPPQPPTWEDMQTAAYWHADAERLAKTERLLLAAASTYEATGQMDLAEQYYRAAEDVYITRIDSLAEASILAWYEERDRDL